jgi:hypothetical protein
VADPAFRHDFDFALQMTCSPSGCRLAAPARCCLSCPCRRCSTSLADSKLFAGC